MTAYLKGCDWFCEACAPNNSEGCDDGGGESDCPQNCAGCGMPLDNPLTSEGVEYVLDRAEREAENVQHIIPLKGTAEEEGLEYYRGEPHCAIVMEWLLQLAYYRMPKDQNERYESVLAKIIYLYQKSGGTLRGSGS